MEAPSEVVDYFAKMQAGLNIAHSVASRARRKGVDPEESVEIKPAADVAARVEEIVGPPGIAPLIRKLEKEGKERKMIAFEVVKKIAKGECGKGEREELIEQAVRTGVGILTEGVLVAPTEGISKIRIRKNPDGSNYLSMYFSGPIRSAGGTVAALSVVLGDLARKEFGIAQFRPTETELERYVEEITIYDARAARLQYKPSDDEIKHIVRNCPVCIDGDPTERIEVAVHRDIKRIETNRIRGGVGLVICEGIAQKASKVMRYAKKIGLDWSWLRSLVKVGRKEGKPELRPLDGYLNDIVAGRPIFSYPMRPGGFRLRYGRTRASGLMGKAIHPAAMILLDSFPVIGTQLKLERPGKGCIITPCDSIEGPVVKLSDGSVRQIDSTEEAERVLNDVHEVLFLGDILISFGDFLKSNHPLAPSGYCHEWWAAEAGKNGVKGAKDKKKISAEEAFKLSADSGIPLHPSYTYFWHDITAAQLKELVEWLKEGEPTYEWFTLKETAIESSPAKRVLELLCVPHAVEKGTIKIEGNHAYALLKTLGILKEKKMDTERFDKLFNPEKDIMENVNILSGIKIRKKAPTYIGSRMGRPEKAKKREMRPPVHVLFPIGLARKNRDILSLYKKMKEGRGEGKTISVEIARMRCQSCGSIVSFPTCPVCGGKAVAERTCTKCGKRSSSDTCPCGGRTAFYEKRNVNLVGLLDEAKKRCGAPPSSVKGVKGLISKYKIPEPLEKGILRSRRGVSVFRDGTCRFDSTNVPLTHFTPKEVGVPVEKLKELGYKKDFTGNDLKKDDQLLELFPQDMLISENGADYFLKVGAFVDDLLVSLYGLKAFYNMHKREDLIGRLVVTLSPHTSAGVLARIIGFTKARVGYAHPYIISARRRNCFSGGENIPIFDGTEWEFFKLRDIVEKSIKEGTSKKDDFGNIISKNNHYQTLALNPATKKFVMAKITAFSKHIAPGHFVKLKTKSGRIMNVTGEHPIPKFNGAGFEKQMAFNATEAIIPRKIDIKEKDARRIDLLELPIHDIMVKGMAKEVRKKYKNLQALSKHLGINYKTFMDFVYRDSFPLAILRKLNIPIPNDVKVGAKRDAKEIPRSIAVDEDFLYLLGFYIAEGYSRKQDKMCYQVCFTATKEEVRREISKKIRKVFKTNSTYDCRNNISICSRIIYSLFTNYLKIGSRARTKSVPSFVFALPKKKVAAFLRGYFTGDGSVSKSHTIEVNCTSVNKKLIDQVAFLLLRFGIAHSVYTSDRVIKSKIITDFYGKKGKRLLSYKLRCYGKDAEKFINEIGFSLSKKKKAIRLLKDWRKGRTGIRGRRSVGDVFTDKIKERKYRRYNENYTYSLTVEPHHNLICSNLVNGNCDGDEDSCMLLLDALLNFSKKFLPASRGGTMDAPLVLTTLINPKEVDDEVHSMEICSSYPLEFYEACEKLSPPADVDIRLVGSTLGTPEQYRGLLFSHPTSSINNAPTKTAYVLFESMADKVNAQLQLEKKIRAVDEKDVAERVLLSHFLPDLYGNLRSFSRQTFRCVDCNSKYRRVPLIGKCRRCGGKLLLTIHKGGIEKYLQISKDMVKKYGLPDYLAQRLSLLESDIASVFEDEKSKQYGLADFM